jgi:hypothetical protein
MEKDTGIKYSGLELAKILGEPKDPRKPYTMLQSTICEVGTAEPEDYVYSFDVLMDTDKIYTITSNGELTQENVTPDSPALLTFIDVASPEYYVKITDLAKKKEDVLARKTMTINRALNAYENRLIVSAIDGAVQTANQFDLSSGKTTFTYANLVDMLDAVQDYGDKFVLIAGTAVAKDIVLWDWNDNKYQSLKAALADLNIEIIRVNQTVTIDGGSTPVIASTKAYLVATDTEVGKPVLFVRKKLDSISMLGGVMSENGDVPERLIISSSNPVTVLSGSKRYLAVGVTGYEEVVVSVVNPYAIAAFTRS